MKIPIKNLNEVKSPNNGVLLFVDVEDSKLKGKKSNNEVLDFSNSSDDSMKFYKCLEVKFNNSEPTSWVGLQMIWANVNETPEYPYVLSGFPDDIVNQKYKQIEYTDTGSEYISEDGQVTIREFTIENWWAFTIVWEGNYGAYEIGTETNYTRMPLENMQIAGYKWCNTSSGEFEESAKVELISGSTSSWIESSSETNELPIVGFTPEVNKIYNSNTTIEVSKMYSLN